MARGRPRQYDEADALDAAMRLFWRQGFTGTSLDDLAKATSMNRPSLYNAFGNKKALYRRALHHFADRMRTQTFGELTGHADITDALTAYYYAVLDVYFDAQVAQGCLYFCTAAPEATDHADIRQELLAAIRELDNGFEQRLRRAQTEGQLPQGADSNALAAIAQALQHSLSIRARAGVPKRELRRFVRASVQTLLGL